MDIAALLKTAKEIAVWIQEHTSDSNVPNERRMIMAASSFQHALDIADGIIVLIDNNLPGVAFTLLRSLHESYVQAVWLLNVATEDQLTRYENGICPKLQTLVKQIGDEEETGGAFIKGMTEKNISDFHNLTHGGVEHLMRRQTETSIEPNYRSEEIEALLRARNQYATLSAFFLLTQMAKKDSIDELNSRVQSWSDAL